MGIYGLWPLLEPTATPITLESLEGKRLAVDISLWLHQALQGYSAHNLSSRNPHLALLLHRISKLLYYKIRPVFVFDGERIPVFKHQLLRERRIKRDVDELTSQKKILEEVIKDLNDSGSRDSFSFSPVKKMRRSNDGDDLFALPSTPKLEVDKKQTHASDSSDDFLQGYEQLASKDARIIFLKEAKERARQQRLRDDQIPKDSRNFSDFQLHRLLKRNKINEQLDELKKEKMERYLQVSEDQLKTVVVDSRMRSHVLTKDDEIMEIDDPQKKAHKESVTWPQFLKELKDEYEKDSDNKPELLQEFHTSFILDSKVASLSKKRDEQVKLGEESEDDDLQEAILASLQEQQGLSEKTFRSLPESGFSKTALVDKMTSVFEKRKNDMHQDSWTDEDNISSCSSSDDGFIDVPIEEEDSRDQFRVPQMLATGKRKPENMPYEPKPSTSKAIAHDVIEDSLDADEEYFPRKKGGDDVQIGLVEGEREGIYADCQQMLALLGLPYITAPGEAEAQCVCLESLDLVDGIITDDSDVWVFGGKCVYKNMFSRKKNVHRFLLKAIKDQLGLDRLEFIQLAMLSGGDYTRGLEKVGMVTALEILVEFADKSTTEGQSDEEKTFENLCAIREWLLSKRKFEEENKKSPEKKHFIENSRRIKLRRSIESHNDLETIEMFPNREIFNAYMRPMIDDSNQRFKWERVNFQELEEFLWNKLGWSKEMVEKDTHGAFVKWDKFMEQATQQYQTRITAFAQKHQLTKTEEEQKLAPSPRVKAALERLFKVKGLSQPTKENEPSLICKSRLIDKPKPSKSGPGTKKSRASSIRTKVIKTEPQPIDEEDDFNDEETDRLLSEAALQSMGDQHESQPMPSTSKLTSANKKSAPMPKVPKKPAISRMKRKLPPAALVPVRKVPQRDAKKKAAALKPQELNLSEESSSENTLSDVE